MLSFRESRYGHIITITGPVFSGKTTGLERILNSAHGIIWDRDGRHKRRILLAKHPQDDSSSQGRIAGYSALSTADPCEIADRIAEETEAVVISGINFFTSSKIVDLVQSLALSNRRVYAAGHNLDWDANPFNFMPQVMALSDEFVITDAPCMEPGCERQATRSSSIGGKAYRVCLDHHYFDGRPDHRHFLKGQTGGLEMFVGSMFASKTTLWIQKMRELRANGIDFEVFKWVGDQRYSEEGKQYALFAKGVIGLNKGDEKVEAVLVKDAQDMVDYIECRTPLPELNSANRERMRRIGHVFIDEGQFLGGLYDSVRLRMYQGFKFYITGLLRTWKMEPFGQIDRLLALADRIHVMNGYCEVCGRDASENQRLVRAGRRLSPVDYSEPIIAVGGKSGRGAVKNEYQARCKDCIEIPGMPALAYSFPFYTPPSTVEAARKRMK